MKKIPFRNVLLVLFWGILTTGALAQARLEAGIRNIPLSGLDWWLWADHDATYQNDTLWLPPVDISQLPHNAPGCGWDALRGKGKTIHLPATVEEHFWGWNGSTYGVTGDYYGVSWFSTTVHIPKELEGKKVQLRIERARVRAEIYVNNRLAGYNLVDGTPFTTDLSSFLHFGADNFIAIRITEPYGNFTWCDWPLYQWGKYKTVPSHGFAGITGEVELQVTDPVFIDDVFIKNKPNPREIDLEVSFCNATQKPVSGKLSYTIRHRKTNEMVYSKVTGPLEIGADTVVVKENALVKDALLWSVETPELYYLTLKWEGEDGTRDEVTERFGFRWFEVRDVAGDKQFYLNGKRIVLRTSISWGFWPVNGIWPTDELAARQIDIAKSLGLNMLNFHRAIGHEKILDLADEKGLLYYAEPGGYKAEGTAFSNLWKRTKILRMVKHFRNHPSLIIYNMENESCINPPAEAYTDMRDCHLLDETRIITYTSQYYTSDLNNGKCPITPFPSKLHMLPYDHKQYEYGWWDEHHAGGPGAYTDTFYRSPTDYYRYTTNKPEIIFYGEEGAIGSPGRFQLIKDEIEKNNLKGWDSDDYLALYAAWDEFLTRKGFKTAFPNVDSLTRSMGNVAFYYQGRIIENIRINNTIDGYVVNGWEEEKLENHSGIVDCYRNPKGDVNLIARYNQPLYVAVKLRNKVMETGKETAADLFIVNEKDVRGKYDLVVTARDAAGVFFSQKYPVNVSGGIVYGQLLKEGVKIVPRSPGYSHVEAELRKGKAVIAKGSDKIFSVQNDIQGISTQGMVYDTSGTVQKFFSAMNLPALPEYTEGKPQARYLVCGNVLPRNSYTVRQELLEWVAEGNALLITAQADQWAEYLNQKEIIDYRGKKDMGVLWYGGTYFVREHPLFEGLPVNTAFNWEYQSFGNYDNKRIGLRIMNDETIVGCYSDHRQELYSAVSVIRLGKGVIVLSALDMLPDLLSNDPCNSVSKHLMLNYLRFVSPK